MNILWFSWKDIHHPQAGGAELISFNVMKNLVHDGNSVTLITAHYPGALKIDSIEGVKVYRTGGRFSVYIKAWQLFRRLFRDWPNLVIDEMNTIPFGAAFYTRKRTVLLTYQLAREVWFYQIVFPFSFIGYVLEPLYLLLFSRKYKTILTESESTRQNLKKFGFPIKNVHVFRIGMSLKPIESFGLKKNMKTVLSLGALRPMKRTIDAVKGFELARDKDSDLRLVIAGDDSSPYGRKVVSYVSNSRHRDAIHILGRVDSNERLRLMREATVILVTSIKEGWGLIITEANSQGTPAIAYDVDGLRDSVKDGETGILVPSGSTSKLGESINSLLADKQRYKLLQKAAWHFSHEFTFENSYTDFKELVFPPETR